MYNAIRAVASEVASEKEGRIMAKGSLWGHDQHEICCLESTSVRLELDRAIVVGQVARREK